MCERCQEWLFLVYVNEIFQFGLFLIAKKKFGIFFFYLPEKEKGQTKQKNSSFHHI